MTSHEKKEKIRQLAECRKGYNPFSELGYKQVECYDLDCKGYVVPWTIGANDAESDLMIIGQDWCSASTLDELRETDEFEALREHGQLGRYATNKKLKSLLSDHLNWEFGSTWATDAFVWIKPGGMHADIPYKLMLESVGKFTIEEIQIIKPKVAAVLGRLAFRAIKRVANVRGGSRGRIVDLTPFEYQGVKIVPVYHTGSRSNVVDKDDIDTCWLKVRNALEA